MAQANPAARRKPTRAARGTAGGPPVEQTFWQLLIATILTVALLGLALFLLLPGWTRAVWDLSVPIQSPLRADYSVDPSQYALQPVKIEIVGDVLADREQPEEGAPVEQLATVVDNLRTPVPTVTPMPSAAATTPSGVFPPDDGPPTAGPRATATLPAASPTATQRKTASPTPTRTMRLPALSLTPSWRQTGTPATPTLRPSLTQTRAVFTKVATNTQPPAPPAQTKVPTKVPATATKQAPQPAPATATAHVQPTRVPPTAQPPTAVPPTAVPPTAVPPTAVPPTAAPPPPPTAPPPTQPPPPPPPPPPTDPPPEEPPYPYP